MSETNNGNFKKHVEQIIVAHPYKQHSYQLATALKKSGRLSKYITTVYNQGSPITKFVKRFISNNLKAKLEKKACVHLNKSFVKQYCEISGYIFLIIARISIFKHWYRTFGAWMNKRFGIKVAKFAIRNKVDAVVMYDTTADSCFHYLKKHAPNIIRILDVSSNASIARLKFYNDIMLRDPTSDLKNESEYLWNSSFQKRNLREIYNTDYFFVPSIFSKNSIVEQGVDKDKLFVIPYGVDTKKFEYKVRMYQKNRRLKFVYTGVVSYGKGVNILLEALTSLSEDQYSIYIMGMYYPNSKIYQDYKGYNNVHFLGHVTHNELSEIYSDADVFLFASLGEGFTLSGLEAMACGLPVICSENSGINDIIDDYKNGIVFKVGDIESLSRALKWICDNQALLPSMSENAYLTSRKYTWENYYFKINDAFDKIFT